ncbi:uncharacterized protein GLRG_02106 [Colletotrichum graminicola M1.001]|uniref:Riboflavin kinase n=1 Tax=Colletotrichum graminicola (strain M1.001 / M2 / FGSC 10212) TaxID=645133 RepID=E3Q7S3_COLGM|nr:uncharacterized protein GLRG_02106 [Colletotrichum graminicola M1.001]EFQ26935.1 hypothetical protein GLRG_02106 [Colletotrichum graminicola M1.001]
MYAPDAATFRRKPLPGPPPGPPPPPPDFDPFPQRHQPLRGARSTPNLRQSATPSIYDPPPAYEEFPGVNSRGRLAVDPPIGPGPRSGRAPSPSPSPRQEYRPYRPQAPPSSGRGEQSASFPLPSPAPSAFGGYPAEPAKSARPEILPYRPPQPSSNFGPGGRPSPAPSDYEGYFPGPPVTAPPEKSPYQLQPSSTFNSGKQSLAPPSPGPYFPAPTTTATTDSQATAEKSFWQTALEETKYFAGGLVSHPFEYTKHHSILRHSGALVWYRGPSTSVTVTVFSDAPLPPTRTVWLQQKGFSGNMGMNLKSLVGATTSWLDVTPSTRAAPADLADADERGCQRDIRKFLRKAPKNLAAHAPRETHVVRIPAAADDGYFRLVLCSGGGGDGTKRKVLCPSPVFRVASTSTDASVVRGASLASMPLEIGIKAGSVVAATVVNKYIGPAAAVVQARAKTLSKAKVVTKHAAHAANIAHVAQVKGGIDKSGIRTHVAAFEDRYAAARGAGYDAWQSGDAAGAGFQEAPPEVVGSDDGPSEPFPIKFDGRVARGTGRGGAELGVPTANLTDVPGDVRVRMRGVYFGWARVVLPEAMATTVSADWHESLVTVGPAPYATPRVAAKNVATVHLIHEFGGAQFLGARLKVLVMGQLRASAPPADGSDAALAAYGADVLLAVASLSRENWGPEETRERLRATRSEMSLADRYVEARDRVQKQVDRVPLHLAGVRTEGAALRDRAFGNGGLWIPR